MARSFNEEEEELSFCDLPVKEEQNPIITAVQIADQDDDDEGFDFKHRPAVAPAMCAAEEVFFQGHMLPFGRLSFSSSENGLNNNNNNLGRNLWFRSESMDHNVLRFSSSSRSSSTSTSHYSRCSSISNNSISIPTTSSSKARAEKNNVFHSHPSPTPQIRSFSTSSHRSRCRSSSRSRWHFFRLGLLGTPGVMELHDLKTRTTNTMATAVPKPTGTGSFLGVVSCKRSVEAIPAAPVRSSSRNFQKEKEKEKKAKEGEERRVSHRRTFEWLKQLSHATLTADEP
ncbi:uncharacterized protein LOC111017891 [Momordica charantia]|uniref:Uncharacterized protein LOC111017891 n=1 Tax=Momordica charantia TaxID=3673 RepID=A0A6J1D819_MOMCH|nr:uncharacterized protein LOC111017891 [Momordica charantia]